MPGKGLCLPGFVSFRHWEGERGNMLNVLLTDLRYAWRAARRSLGVALAIIAMLALGTGGVTAVFNPVYSTLFAPLPFPQYDQMVVIGGDIPIFNGHQNIFEYEEELGRIFSNLTTYAPFPATRISITDTGEIKEVYAVDVNEDFFETIGVLPLRGTDFKRSEMSQGIVVSNHFWRNELMGADDAIGKIIQAGIRTLPIIGIMPESFDFPSGADFWMSSGSGGVLISDARQYLGRLRLGMSMGRAIEELNAIDFKPGSGLRGNNGPLLQSLQTVIRGDRRAILLMLGSAAALFLLLVCAGVMNLLITQGARRKSEMAMRLILGATRRKLVFQLLREILPLVVVGSLSGLWISEVASVWLMTQFPVLNGGEVIIFVKTAFFMTLVLAVTIISGLTPALYATGINLNTYLKSENSHRKRFFSLSLRELLTGVQLSLTLALLMGVGLLVISMMFHVDIPIRWSSHDMFIVQAEFPITPESSTPEAMTSRVLFFQELQHRLATMPEVAASGVFSPLPFSADAVRVSQNYRVTSKIPYAEKGIVQGMATPTFEGHASPEGFEILGIQLIAGRYFSPTDMTTYNEFQIGSQEALRTRGRAFVNIFGGVVIINQSLAKQFWPRENAVGKIIYGNLSNAYRIVGVVRDFHQVGDNKSIVPAIYYPPEIWRPVTQKFIVKLHSRFLIKDFQQRLADFDTGSVTIEIRSFEEVVSNATANTRMTLQLLGIFAVLGIVVSGFGVYATTSLMAAAWNREIGIRMALGARTWDILRLALWRGMRAIFFGLPFGLFLALILSRILSRYLFQVKVDDPLVWIISCAFLLIVTIIAALVPVLRAIRVNPMIALHDCE